MTSAPLQGKTIAFAVANEGIEQVELEQPWDAVKAAGGTPVLVSLEPGTGPGVQPPRQGRRRSTSTRRSPTRRRPDYDGLVLPGGVANPDALRTDDDAVRFVKDFVAAGKPVAAICHAPWTLVEAGVLDGRRLTSWPSLQTDIRNAGGTWVDEEVVTRRVARDEPQARRPARVQPRAGEPLRRRRRVDQGVRPHRPGWMRRDQPCAPGPGSASCPPAAAPTRASSSRLAAPEGGRAVWVRYTTLRYADGRLSGALWFSAFGQDRRSPVGRLSTAARWATPADAYVEVDGGCSAPARRVGISPWVGRPCPGTWPSTTASPRSGTSGPTGSIAHHCPYQARDPQPGVDIRRHVQHRRHGGGRRGLARDGRTQLGSGARRAVGVVAGQRHRRRRLSPRHRRPGGSSSAADSRPGWPTGCSSSTGSGCGWAACRLRGDLGRPVRGRVLFPDDRSGRGGLRSVPASRGRLGRLGLRGSVGRSTPCRQLLHRRPQPHRATPSGDPAPRPRSPRRSTRRLPRAGSRRPGGSLRVARFGHAAGAAWSRTATSTDPVEAARRGDAVVARAPAPPATGRDHGDDPSIAPCFARGGRGRHSSDAVADLYAFVYASPRRPFARRPACGSRRWACPMPGSQPVRGDRQGRLSGNRRVSASRQLARTESPVGGRGSSHMQHDHAPVEAPAPSTWGAPLPLVYCPECGMPAWVEWRDVGGTGGAAPREGALLRAALVPHARGRVDGGLILMRGSIDRNLSKDGHGQSLRRRRARRARHARPGPPGAAGHPDPAPVGRARRPRPACPSRSGRARR